MSFPEINPYPADVPKNGKVSGNERFDVDDYDIDIFHPSSTEKQGMNRSDAPENKKISRNENFDVDDYGIDIFHRSRTAEPSASEAGIYQKNGTEPIKRSDLPDLDQTEPPDSEKAELENSNLINAQENEKASDNIKNGEDVTAPEANQNLPDIEKTENKDVQKDDNGNPYRIGNDLIPNNTYEINGYKYQTDEKGRIISAEGSLQAKDHEGRPAIKDKMEDVGKGDQKGSDERGHLIGDQFNGSNGLENLTPQDAKINEVEVKKLENELAKEVKSGSEVYLKIEPHYLGDSHRPDSYTYTYTVNGEKSVKIFKNGT